MQLSLSTSIFSNNLFSNNPKHYKFTVKYVSVILLVHFYLLIADISGVPSGLKSAPRAELWTCLIISSINSCFISFSCLFFTIHGWRICHTKFVKLKETGGKSYFCKLFTWYKSFSDFAEWYSLSIPVFVWSSHVENLSTNSSIVILLFPSRSNSFATFSNVSSLAYSFLYLISPRSCFSSANDNKLSPSRSISSNRLQKYKTDTFFHVFDKCRMQCQNSRKT